MVWNPVNMIHFQQLLFLSMQMSPTPSFEKVVTIHCHIPVYCF